MTYSGKELKKHYAPNDLAGFDYSEKLGDRASIPIPGGSREKCTATALDHGHVFGIRVGRGGQRPPTGCSSSRGRRGFSVALDLPTQMGLDSDDPLSRGEIGKVGVAIDSLSDIEVAVRRHRAGQAAADPDDRQRHVVRLTGVLHRLCQKHGIDPNSMGSISQNDPLKEYISRGNLYLQPKARSSSPSDVIEYCGASLPKWTPISSRGITIREGGCTRRAGNRVLPIRYDSLPRRRAGRADSPSTSARKEYLLGTSAPTPTFWRRRPKFRAFRRHLRPDDAGALRLRRKRRPRSSTCSSTPGAAA
jgi:methylmalonyl-CoA mutase N-terminal domain/subunit